jgi:CheY-like chemotaxis protein
MSNTGPSEHSIIVVEDDKNEVFLLQRAFREAGVNNPVLLFRDGQEVMDYLSRLGPDDGKQISDAPPALMLLDLKMPRKNGLEVIEWLRTQPVLKRLVVVMLSSSDNASDINRAYDLGCNSYLIKPMSLGGLVEMVKLLDSYWLRTNQRAVSALKQAKDLQQ